MGASKRLLGCRSTKGTGLANVFHLSAAGSAFVRGYGGQVAFGEGCHRAATSAAFLKIASYVASGRSLIAWPGAPIPFIFM